MKLKLHLPPPLPEAGAPGLTMLLSMTLGLLKIAKKVPKILDLQVNLKPKIARQTQMAIPVKNLKEATNMPPKTLCMPKGWSIGTK